MHAFLQIHLSNLTVLSSFF